MIKGLAEYPDFIEYLANSCLHFLDAIEIIMIINHFQNLTKVSELL